MYGVDRGRIALTAIKSAKMREKDETGEENFEVEHSLSKFNESKDGIAA